MSVSLTRERKAFSPPSHPPCLPLFFPSFFPPLVILPHPLPWKGKEWIADLLLIISFPISKGQIMTMIVKSIETNVKQFVNK